MAEKATNVNLIKATIQQMPVAYQDRIPEVTRANLDKVYDAIWNYEPARNAFISALVGVIGMQTVESSDFRNPLAELKMNPMIYGDTDQEIFVNMAKGQGIDGFASADKALGFYESYVMSLFHNVNYSVQYPVTMRYAQMRSAFLSEYGLRDLIVGKFRSATAGAAYDEYKAMLQLLLIGYEKQILPVTVVDTPTDKETAENLMVEMQAFVEGSEFPNPANNPAGSTATSTPKSMVTFLTPKTKALMGVKALANAYNLDYADFKTRLKVVDKFDDRGNIQAIVCDARFFRCRDHFREITESRNGAAMSINYFYNVMEVISASLFYPIMVFISGRASEIQSITGTNITNAEPGKTYELDFKATPNTSSYAPQLFDITIASKVVGGNEVDGGTYIVPGTQTLVISSKETNFPISITAKSRVFSSFTKTITVNDSE